MQIKKFLGSLLLFLGSFPVWLTLLCLAFPTFLAQKQLPATPNGGFWAGLFSFWQNRWELVLLLGLALTGISLVLIFSATVQRAHAPREAQPVSAGVAPRVETPARSVPAWTAAPMRDGRASDAAVSVGVAAPMGVAPQSETPARSVSAWTAAPERVDRAWDAAASVGVTASAGAAAPRGAAPQPETPARSVPAWTAAPERVNRAWEAAASAGVAAPMAAAPQVETPARSVPAWSAAPMRAVAPESYMSYQPLTTSSVADFKAVGTAPATQSFPSSPPSPHHAPGYQNFAPAFTPRPREVTRAPAAASAPTALAAQPRERVAPAPAPAPQSSVRIVSTMGKKSGY